MSSLGKHQVTSLSELQRVIKDLGGGELSDAVKALAVWAVESGNSRRLVARTVGVTGRTIGNWRLRKFKLPTALKAAPKPVRLQVLRERAPLVPSPPPQLGCGIAKIIFKTGIVVELPTSFLRAALIADLNGGCE